MFDDVDRRPGPAAGAVRPGDLGAGQPRAVDPAEGSRCRPRGERRYLDLVQRCRDLDVLTPEDDYAVWEGAGGPVAVAPLFVLYDYSFRMPGMLTKAMALQHAVRHRGRVHRRDAAAPRPVPQSRGVVPGPGRVHPAAAGRGRSGAAHRSGQPLSAGPPADRRAAAPAVRAVVRHRADRRLARAVPRRARRSTVTCTSRVRPGTTVCRSRRSRWAIRGSGRPARPRPRCCARCSGPGCPHDGAAPRHGDGLLSRFEGRFAASADLVDTAVTAPACAPEPGRASGPVR